MKKYLFIALGLAFGLIAINALIESKPTEKAPIYKSVKRYSPYYLDKRFGGLEILSREDREFKEKPSNMEVFHRLEYLEREWGKSHLKIEGNTLVVSDSNGSVVDRVPLSNGEDIEFIHRYYGV